MRLFRKLYKKNKVHFKSLYFFFLLVREKVVVDISKGTGRGVHRRYLPADRRKF